MLRADAMGLAPGEMETPEMYTTLPQVRSFVRRVLLCIIVSLALYLVFTPMMVAPVLAGPECGHCG